ncbi:hypothetical protein [Oceaniglobus ichthyenteri]|uniref:hypothetical protein n=1 Tax=Oceaniglobus ichthyenteri TaxID=2136177 RepID=UPI000D37893A|nr:hypothetical protein [Oceaniglobus ichthyenteri]
MRRLIAPIVFALSLIGTALVANAACYADYKAKTDNPLRLHYGVVQLPDRACSLQAARPLIERRIAVDGWQLLTVLSVFDDAGLGERKDSAGAYFLRY